MTHPHAPLRIVGRDPARAVTFANSLFLAPMEGVTEPCFRDLVINLGGVGSACTEFVRVSNTPVPRKVMERYLGAVRRDCVVAIQLMASDTEHLAESVCAAEQAGAAYIDLNFGCPAPVVFNKCAGSALLCHPERLFAITRAAVEATTLPVTAKLRAGISDDSRLCENLAALVEGGAAMITLHGRLRIHSYAHPSRWDWISQAKDYLRQRNGPPLVGNGSVESAEDAARMRAETGCEGVMIGRGALADPWVFRAASGGSPATRAEAAHFPRRYAAEIAATYSERKALARVKQLLRYYRAANLLGEGDPQRTALLRSDSLADILDWFDTAARPSGLRSEG
jgi:tRNA-dihydrouridine synthase C